MSTFDPQLYMDQSWDQSNDTKLTPIPDGEYPCIIEPGTVEFKTWQSRDGTKNGIKLAMRLNVDSPEVRQTLGRDKVTVRYEVMIDTLESGAIDMGKGKNVGLGRLRQAVGLNEPGRPFSPRMLEGRMLRAKIGHRIDGEDIYDEVKGVAPV